MVASHNRLTFELRLALCLSIVVSAGCASTSTVVRVVDLTPPQQAVMEVPEELLLDVGVAVFDPNVPESFDDQRKDNIIPEVRRAEGNYMAYFTKNLLQSTGNWGAVRVIPRETHAVDVVVSGTIHHSDGERMIVEVTVRDSRGQEWFTREFETLASKYAYEDTIPPDIDPFQATYRQIVDEMTLYVQNLSADEIQEIRTTAEMKFAREFSPDAFASHVVETGPGAYEVRRLPAQDDPMLGRVRRVREREYLFIDTLDEYFDGFYREMYPSYQNWRSASYGEAIAFRNQRDKARRKTVAGAVAIASGLLSQKSDNIGTRYGGVVGVIGGATIALQAIEDRAEAKLHAEVLQELGASAEAEIAPHTIDLENQTLRLQGTVDAQYVELRRILRRIYFEEMGLEMPDDLVEEIAEEEAAKAQESQDELFDDVST